MTPSSPLHRTAPCFHPSMRAGHSHTLHSGSRLRALPPASGPASTWLQGCHASVRLGCCAAALHVRSMFEVHVVEVQGRGHGSKEPVHPHAQSLLPDSSTRAKVAPSPAPAPAQSNPAEPASQSSSQGPVQAQSIRPSPRRPNTRHPPLAARATLTYSSTAYTRSASESRQTPPTSPRPYPR